MIHLALWILSALFVAVVCLVALSVAYALVRALIRVLISWVSEAVDVATALFFFLVLLPPVWVWEKLNRWERRRARAAGART